MLRVAAEDGGCGCRRTRRCFFCDNQWKFDKKLNSLSRWSWRPRTWTNWAVILITVFNVVSGDSDGAKHYTSQWAVHIEGGQEIADGIAAKHGFVNLGKIFEDFYHFEHKKLQKRSLTPHIEYHSNLINEAQVRWAQQQVVKSRSKRDLVALRPRSKSSIVRFNDVEWPQMWYLNRGQGLDMNVQEAWVEGISGKGVVVTILDDGLEKNHPDLVANYDPQASYDVNSYDEDPMPRYDPVDSNRHGTRCAGEVAAVANNSLCSVGVAFGANVGGVRMLDGDVTDAVEARSLSLNPQHIDIYSASWGPDDDGKTVDGPGELATRAFIEGVTKGRQGKGSIFVWASGNGGREHDNCNCDGYTNSIWTLSISSATENGFVPWYSEACSSTLATTYSSGGVREKQIVTTDLRHKCTNGHTGTSASAPLAAGICALALEANRDLTWRDMQHIVVRTARPANLKSSDWKVNGVGRNVSHSFGYGLMDAAAMVRLARTWKTVPEQHRCEVPAPHVDKMIPARSKVILNLNVTECAGVNFLEHVQAKISLSSSRRGDLQIYLTSPAGTRSTLLARRPQDLSRNPFNAWPFMSVHTWGEMPFGIWQLEIHNEGRYLGRANLQEWSLLFYGTSQIPTGTSDEQRPPQKLSPKSAPAKTGALPLNPKPNKNSSVANFVNRKSYKNGKTKSTASRVGKVSSAGAGSNGTKPTASPSKNSKSTQKSKWKDSSQKSTSAPPSTHSLPLTIVLGPSGNQKVPDVFQKYPKVQQLFPLYLNTGRMYEENFLIPKVQLASSKTQKYLPKEKAASHLSVQKAERQNRFDTSSLTRTSSDQKAQNKNAPFRNQQTQGHFEGWQMIFFGTEDSPNGGILPGQAASGKAKSGLASKVSIEDDVANHLEGDVPSRGWKDQATRRDDVTRTTSDPLGSPSSGCVALAASAAQCLGRGSRAFEGRQLRGMLRGLGGRRSSSAPLVLGINLLLTCPFCPFIECERGLYLYLGRCESNCPPRTHPGINAKERAACMPCHYTCLTCAGETEGECTSCHDEAVPTPSGLKDAARPNIFNVSVEVESFREPEVKVEDLSASDDGEHLSWGKRRTPPLVSSSVLRKKAVTKKILEPYDAPRLLYFCYPPSVVNKMRANDWYRRMTLLFAVNLLLLFGVLLYFLWSRFRRRKSGRPDFDIISYRYSKMNSNGSSLNPGNAESILYVSSSTEDE